MIDRIRRVAVLRHEVAELKEAKDASRAKWEKENEDLLTSLDDVAAKLADAEGDLRLEALLAYGISGNRKPVVGVEIKLFTAIKYDPDEALRWAREYGLALKLDTLAFERIAKSTVLEFVEIAEVPKALIAQDLDKALN